MTKSVPSAKKANNNAIPHSHKPKKEGRSPVDRPIGTLLPKLSFKSLAEPTVPLAFPLVGLSRDKLSKGSKDLLGQTLHKLLHAIEPSL